MSDFRPRDKELLEKAVKSYLDDPSDANLEEVMRNTKKLVFYFARYFSTEGRAVDDLVQAGYEGVLKSLRKYNCSYEVKFATFASHYIAGEIKKELSNRIAYRSGGKWIYIIRRKVENAREKLTRELGQEPSVEDISREINLTEEGVRLALMAEVINIEDVDLVKIKSRYYENFQLPIEDKIALEEALKSLTDLQKQVIYYLFYLDLTQSRAGEILGINQRRVSRVMCKALTKMSYLLG